MVKYVITAYNPKKRKRVIGTHKWKTKAKAKAIIKQVPKKDRKTRFRNMRIRKVKC
tara:strand:- start:1141 stop:1308 length:168 start_codon:yes stop_codon:yes gene_type:complete